MSTRNRQGNISRRQVHNRANYHLENTCLETLAKTGEIDFSCPKTLASLRGYFWRNSPKTITNFLMSSMHVIKIENWEINESSKGCLVLRSKEPGIHMLISSNNSQLALLALQKLTPEQRQTVLKQVNRSHTTALTRMACENRRFQSVLRRLNISGPRLSPSI